MAINKVNIWKKFYAWMTYMRPHFLYAAHIYCNERINAPTLNKMDTHTRDYIK